jgi:hypothetical protein
MFHVKHCSQQAVMHLLNPADKAQFILLYQSVMCLLCNCSKSSGTAMPGAGKYIGAWGTLFKEPHNLAVARRTAGPLYNSTLDSPFDDSTYYVCLSRLSEADWLRYLGRGRCVVEIKMRLFEKSSPMPRHYGLMPLLIELLQ